MRQLPKRPSPSGSDRPPTWGRFSLALVLLTCAGFAFAQPRRPRPAPPKPPKTAEPATPAAPQDAGAAPVIAAASADGGTAIADPGSMAGLDGGVRSSPLNPSANEFPSRTVDGGAPPPVSGPDYDRLLADVAALRARIATAQDALFRSRIGIAVKLDGKHAKLTRLAISLDDGAVYAAPAGFRPEEFTTVYDHAVAPGKHAVTVDVERRDDRDEAFRSSQRSRVIVEVPKEQRLDLQVLLVDESDMGGDFPADKSGRYDLRMKFKAVASAAKGAK